MQWKTFEWPKNGDTVVRKRFAVFPIRLTDGYTVWLENYNSLEKFYIQHQDWESAEWKILKTWRIGAQEPVLNINQTMNV